MNVLYKDKYISIPAHTKAKKGGIGYIGQPTIKVDEIPLQTE